MAQTSKTFRIFVSSTFSDRKEARNALQKKVFPGYESYACSMAAGSRQLTSGGA